MSEEKRREPGKKPEDQSVSLPEEVDPDFFGNEEHDGWSEIKRRPSQPDSYPRSEL